MSSRPLFTPYPVITSGDMSQTTITSLVTIIQRLSYVSYTVSWTGTSPVGTLSVEVSNDYTQNMAGSVANSGTWNALSLSGGTAVSGNTGNGVINLNGIASYAIRLKYTKTSGTGTLQAIINGKVS